MIQRIASRQSNLKRFVYGPVPSRRLGYSLGIDLLVPKTCTYNCIYCQLGKTTNQTRKREKYVSVNGVLKELSPLLRKKTKIDYITFSGSGEPTLNSNLGSIIKKVKNLTKIPVAVITNSSTIYDRNIQKNLLSADVVMPTLTTTEEKKFRKIHCPAPGITVKKIIDGLVRFRKLYKGKIWLEIMLIKGINDSRQDILALKKAINKIRPDKIQLNTVVRPPSEKFARPLSMSDLKLVKKIFGNNCEVVAEFKRPGNIPVLRDINEMVLQYLKRRPATMVDMNKSLGINQNELVKSIQGLMKSGKIKKKRYGGKIFYETIKIG
ncbi:MAG: radical SAM protein [candidate division WOR-3 bacterium]